MAHKQYPDALRVALRLGGAEMEGRIKDVLAAAAALPHGPAARRQLAYMLGRQRAHVVLGDDGLDVARDVTSRLSVPAGRRGRARVVAKSDGVLAGVACAAAAFTLLDPAARCDVHRADGSAFRRGDLVLEVASDMRCLLAAERTALNFLQRLSGVATVTRAYVDAVAGTGARILDTRKTTPGLRALEKYAVVCGGGVSHRSGLYDAFLAKDNHLDGLSPKQLPAAIVAAVSRARRHASLAFVMVEVDTPAQFSALLTLPRGVVDAVLLDNMTPAVMRRLVAQRDRRAPWLQLEASGGISARSVRAVARSGVDFISSGAITHSAPQVDFGLDIARGAR
jgi:nicotinate-nucleotide pyrophosphorylase (carboxylating)